MSNRKASSPSPSPLRKFSLRKKLRSLFRSTLLAAGLLALLGGVTCLLTERVVVFPNQKALSLLSVDGRSNPGVVRSLLFKTIRPHTTIALPAWAALTLVGVGATSTLALVATRRG